MIRKATRLALVCVAALGVGVVAASRRWMVQGFAHGIIASGRFPQLSVSTGFGTGNVDFKSAYKKIWGVG